MIPADRSGLSHVDGRCNGCVSGLDSLVERPGDLNVRCARVRFLGAFCTNLQVDELAD